MDSRPIWPVREDNTPSPRALPLQKIAPRRNTGFVEAYARFTYHTPPMHLRTVPEFPLRSEKNILVVRV